LILDDRLGLVLAGFPRLDRGLVLELSVVHELRDRGPRGRGNLDQIKIGFLREPERLVNGDDPDLLALRADKPDLGRADALVDTRFGADVTSTGSVVAAGLSGGCCRDQRLHPEGKSPARRRAPRGNHNNGVESNAVPLGLLPQVTR